MKLDCGHEPSPHSKGTTGYGTDRNGKTHCYECCTEMDKKQMRETGEIVLYLTLTREMHGREGQLGGRAMVLLCKAELSNWPGNLKLPCYVHSGRHNFARKRYDVHFTFEGTKWYGTQYGDNTQICYCRRYKNQKRCLQ